MKRVLIISYYFPPMGLGGVQRTAQFVKYLPEFGWEPVVLTVKDVLYHARDDAFMKTLQGQKVVRTGSFDPQRITWKLMGGKKKAEAKPSHKGRFAFLERANRKILPWILMPDPKVLWLPHAVVGAKKLIRSGDIDLVFTTSPPQSVHLTGLRIWKKTGLPWVADFRDNWLNEQYENVPTLLHRRLNRYWAQKVVRSADRIITVSEPITQDLIFLSGKESQYVTTLLNGFDGKDFKGTESRSTEVFTITHTGALNAVRSPYVFLRGIARAVQEHPELKDKLRIHFVGPVYGIDLPGMVNHLGLKAVVKQVPFVPHEASIEYLMSSDMLLLLISGDSSAGIVTSKIYEYLASGKPIMAVTPKGEAANLVIKHARGIVVPPDDDEAIAHHIKRSFVLWERGDLKVSVPRWEGMKTYERRSQTGVLADIFDRLISERRSK